MGGPSDTLGGSHIPDRAALAFSQMPLTGTETRPQAGCKRFHDMGLNEEGQRAFERLSLNPAYLRWRSDRMQVTIRGTMIEHRRFRRR